EPGRKPVTGAVLHLVGSGLFLALIAVVGQVYHLSSSPGNAVLLWLAGVAPLAWILRLRSQLILSYAGFGVWLWLELIDSPGHAQFGGWFREVFLYVSVGAAFVGCGMHLALTRFKEFAGTTEKFGLLLMNIAAFPLCIGEAYEAPATSKGITLSLIIATLAVGLVTLGIWRNRGTMDGDWKKLWGAAIAGLVLVATLFITYVPEMHWHESRDNPYHWGANVAVFLWCLAQIRVGALRRNKWVLNTGMTFAGITLIAAYFNFSGSLEARGIVFMVGGILMVAGALVMERVRRRMIRKMAPGNPV
ncbi:MAG TPA: DUF2157 domain-containing protein, partial [Candidatus Limnocylindria bacterium]|nr:DUF2157 domain-containing protein [Candidatus Limnocylindria bacterium]